MFETFEKFLDAFVTALEKVGGRIEQLFSGILNGFLTIIEKTVKWLTDFAIKLKDYIS